MALSLIDLGLVVVTFLLFTFTLLLIFNSNFRKQLEERFRFPLKFKTKVSNEKELERIIPLLYKLTSDEQAIILTTLFGRPVKISRTYSTDGYNWLEYVLPLSQDESIPNIEEEKIDRSVG